MMTDQYKSKKTVYQNLVFFSCSDTALDALLALLKHIRDLGRLGCTREITLDGRIYLFDGDGSDKLDNIHVNGLTVPEWQVENSCQHEPVLTLHASSEQRSSVLHEAAG